MSTSQSELLFVEEIAVAFEEAGFPRMSGRVLGWLLICEGHEQTAQDLAENLHASKGSISTATRLLITAGLVERRSQPGERKDRYRVNTDAWESLLRRRLAEATSFRRLIGQGLELLKEFPDSRRDRLWQVHELYVWLDRELQEMWGRWDARQNP
jgi:DNA-binding transcriptional regulator GbsR (MarR family)